MSDTESEHEPPVKLEAAFILYLRTKNDVREYFGPFKTEKEARLWAGDSESFTTLQTFYLWVPSQPAREALLLRSRYR